MKSFLFAMLAASSPLLVTASNPSQFVHHPESGGGSYSFDLSCTAGDVSISTNVSASSVHSDWDLCLGLNLTLPSNTNAGVFASATNRLTFSEHSIQGSVSARAGAWGSNGGTVPGWASATTVFGITFQVLAEVDYQLEVWIGGPWPSPFTLSSQNHGTLFIIPSAGNPNYTGHFPFSGTFDPGDIYTIQTSVSSSGNSGNIDDPSVLFSVQMVPEPTSFALLGLGSLLLFVGSRHLRLRRKD